MARTANIFVRVEPDIKEQAEEKLKLSTIKTEIKEKGESTKMNCELDNKNTELQRSLNCSLFSS